MPKFQDIIKNVLLYKISHFVTSDNNTHLCFTEHQYVSVNQIAGYINPSTLIVLMWRIG